MLVGALDTDVESAQVAAEVKLENLISRGRLGDARLAAEQARYRTVQYAEALRQKLDATRRDVRSVDWLAAVPALLDEALTHIEGRYRAETAILDQHRRPPATRRPSRTRRRQAAELVDVVRDCIQRHTQLQTRLQEAGAVFRAEQDRQQFAERPRRAAIDVFGQLLRPVPGAARRDRGGADRGVLPAPATGVRVPSVPSLGGLVETLLTPPVDRDPLGEPVPEPELAPAAPDRVRRRSSGRRSRAALPAEGGAVRLSAAAGRGPGRRPRTAAAGRAARRCTPSARRSPPPAARATTRCCSPSTTARCCATPSSAGPTCSSARRRCHVTRRDRIACPSSTSSRRPASSRSACGPRRCPARDPGYAELVRRYREDDAFADTVQRVASGLGMVVLAVGDASGMVLAAVEESVFEIRMDEYARRTALANRQADKVHARPRAPGRGRAGLPAPDDLGDDTYVGRVSVDQVDGAVREACRVLEERVAGTDERRPAVRRAAAGGGVAGLAAPPGGHRDQGRPRG